MDQDYLSFVSSYCGFTLNSTTKIRVTGYQAKYLESQGMCTIVGGLTKAKMSRQRVAVYLIEDYVDQINRDLAFADYFYEAGWRSADTDTGGCY